MTVFYVCLLVMALCFMYYAGVQIERKKTNEKDIDSVYTALDIRNNARVDELRKKYKKSE